MSDDLNSNINEDNADFDYGADILTLLDENGNEQEFEMIDAVELDEKVYIALMPLYDDPNDYLGSDGQLVILRSSIDESTGEEIYCAIEDESELGKVMETFKERLEDEYEIEA